MLRLIYKFLQVDVRRYVVGKRQHPADRLVPIPRALVDDECDHHLARRSSPSCRAIFGVSQPCSYLLTDRPQRFHSGVYSPRWFHSNQTGCSRTFENNRLDRPINPIPPRQGSPPGSLVPLAGSPSAPSTSIECYSRRVVAPELLATSPVKSLQGIQSSNASEPLGSLRVGTTLER